MSEQREILFRGKRADNGEWVEGYLIHDEVCNTHIPYIGYLFGGRYIDVDVAEVNPSTVGQYTGLKDKNGTRIFEGDVVRNFLGTHWVDFCAGTYVTHLIEAQYMNYLSAIANECEVIGNIHDNPELLEPAR